MAYLFHIATFPIPDCPVQIMVCSQAYFLAHQNQSDHHLTPELTAAGLLPADFEEVAESCFAVAPGRSEAAVRADLLARGFLEDANYAALFAG
jgi:hypothetical protein